MRHYGLTGGTAAAGLAVLLGLASCSAPPSVADPPDSTQRFIDEIQWFEMSELLEVRGDAGEEAWIAAALSDQLAGRELLLEFRDGLLQDGIADIQLEHDELPLASFWSSPPGELSILDGNCLLQNELLFSHDPGQPINQQLFERMQLSGSFMQETAQLLMQHAVSRRQPQPLRQTNPETLELWLLGRSNLPLHVQWHFQGSLGGVPFDFTASQQLTAVSSYYEISILPGAGESTNPAASRHPSLLATMH